MSKLLPKVLAAGAAVSLLTLPGTAPVAAAGLGESSSTSTQEPADDSAPAETGAPDPGEASAAPTTAPTADGGVLVVGASVLGPAQAPRCPAVRRGPGLVAVDLDADGCDDPSLVARIGAHRAAHGGYRLYFRDIGRARTAPEAIDRLDLAGRFLALLKGLAPAAAAGARKAAAA